MKRKHTIQLIVGILISAAALTWVFWGVTFQELFESFKSVNYWYLIPCLITFYFGIWLRAVRWKYLFRPKYNIPLSHATSGIFICFAFNSVFPARVGEFARAYLIGKKDKTGFPAAFGTVVTERLLDSLVLLGALFVALSIAPIELSESFNQVVMGRKVDITPQQFEGYKDGVFKLALLLVVGIAFMAVPYTRSIFLKILQSMRFVPEKIRNKIESLIENFAKGLQSLGSPVQAVWVIGLSIAAWACNFWSVQIMALGFPFENPVSFLDGLTITVIVAIFITPCITPGYWGFYEAGILVSVTMLLGIHPEGGSLVLAFAILLHLTQWLPITMIGLPWAWFSHVSLDDATQAEESMDSTEE